MNEMEQLREWIHASDNIVFFGGAGVSTESHIPDFRSEDGLYKAKTKYGYSPETLISHSFFQRHTDKFYEYYKDRWSEEPSKNQLKKIANIISWNLWQMDEILFFKATILFRQ